MKFDGRVTLALILAVLLQAASIFIWAGQAQARLDALERNEQASPAVAERLARLEEQVSDARRSLARIENKLDAR
jgi:hypothetical protein